MSSVIRRLAFRAARKVVTALPANAREVAVSLGGRTVDGPVLLPDVPTGPVTVLAAHPDDETIGAGGTIARHAARGDDVRVVVATSGEATTGGRGDVGQAREAECRAALADLGVTRSPVFCRLPDGALHAEVDTLAQHISEHSAGSAVVYVPSVLDPHKDHQAVNTALGMAEVTAGIYGYEVWTAVPVDVLIDVGETWEDKTRALSRYRTALESVDYLRVAEGLAAYRSAAGGMMGRGYAEGFVTLDADTHRAYAAGLPAASTRDDTGVDSS